MACGNKKKVETAGVHLTERTCSPYNPIIKLIVDDCLGLPIYPVSSIDAVIDEDGNTLRQLLNNLLDQINEKDGANDEILNLIELLNSIVQLIPTTYVNNELLTLKVNEILANISGLKAWLMLISKYDANISTEETERQAPHILTFLDNLKNNVQSILRYLGLDPSSPALENPGGLAGEVQELRSLVNSIASCGNTELYANPGVTWIVKYVTDLVNLLNGISTETGSVKAALDDINNKLEFCAHIDREVANLLEGDSEIGRYNVLKASEYPPTSMKFITLDNVDPLANADGLKYFGYLQELPYAGKVGFESLYDLTPFGHTNQDLGYQVKFSTDGHTFTDIVTSDNLYLRIGNGQLGGADIAKEMELCTLKDQKVTFDVGINFINGVTQSNFLLKNLYVIVNGTPVKLGRFDIDGEITQGDVHTIIYQFRTLLSTMPDEQVSLIKLLPMRYSSNRDAGWILYSNSNKDVYYPCIEGKTYVDELTGKLYRYSNDAMIPVNLYDFVGEKLNIKKTELSLPYPRQLITISNDNDYFDTIYTDDLIDNLQDGQLFVNALPQRFVGLLYTISTTVPTNPVGIRKKGGKFEYTTTAVSNMINLLNSIIASADAAPEQEVTNIKNAIIRTHEIRDYVDSTTVSLDKEEEKQELLSELDSIIESLPAPEAVTLENLQTHLSRMYLTSGHSNLKYYFWRLEGEGEELTFYPVEVPEMVFKAKASRISNRNGQDYSHGEDIEQEISSLLDSGSDIFEINVSMSDVLYKKDSTLDDGFSLVPGYFGKTLYNRTLGDFWYITDDQGSLKKFPQYYLGYSETQGIPVIRLYKDAVEISSISLELIRRLEERISALESRIQ